MGKKPQEKYSVNELNKCFLLLDKWILHSVLKWYQNRFYINFRFHKSSHQKVKLNFMESRKRVESSGWYSDWYENLYLPDLISELVSIHLQMLSPLVLFKIGFSLGSTKRLDVPAWNVHSQLIVTSAQ